MPSIPLCFASLLESCSLLHGIHMTHGLLDGVATVLGIDLENIVIDLVPRLAAETLHISCDINYINMADIENHSSMLPQPTRSGSIMRALSEITASDKNSRNTMPPPATNHKRQGSNLPEPALKRKTLVERAGEPIRPSLAAPRSFTPVESTIVPPHSFGHYRSGSNNTTSSYRSNSSASRHTSNSSFSASIGSGLRPPSTSVSNLARPKTALAKDRDSKWADARPATSLNQQGGSLDQSNIKRRTPFSYPMMNMKHAARTPSGSRLNIIREPIPFVALGRCGITSLSVSKRELSLSSQMQTMSLETYSPKTPTRNTPSPSKLPRPMTPAPRITTWNTSPTPLPKSRCKSMKKDYLTRWGNTEAIDAEEHYSNFKRMFEDVTLQYKEALGEVTEAKNTNNLYTETIEKLEQERASLVGDIISLTSETQTLKYRLGDADRAITDQKQYFEAQIEEIKKQHRRELEAQRQELRDDIAKIKSDHHDELKESKRKYDTEAEEERNRRIEALSQASTAGALERQKQQIELDMKDYEINNARVDAQRIQESLDRERTVIDDLRTALTNAGVTATSMESTRQALQAKIDYLESDSKSQSNAYAEMERKMNEAFAEAEMSSEKLRKEETLRRKLHNQVQELKGNIRVFCRVRPTLPSEIPEELATIKFPDTEDSKEIELKGQEEKNSLGKITTKTYPFSFDRVFDPRSNNSEVFEEISQLIQSALDGFNVCIFAYGQTGSGKTYTMSSDDGMIPKALRQIYSTSRDLEERGWKYRMEGSFIEVYNEEIRDLLGKEGESKKHEIRHDMVKCETTITDAVTVSLDSQEQVEEILERAMAKRSVAATSANERSSRSHSVFILRLVGRNSITGEQSKGVLNLVDLAGSERLAHSKVEGQRLKETQSINKSLSCLGDVIGALGQQGTTLSAFDPKASITGSSTAVAAHVPYRNSKLTYLLQFSLGGNSKTLMFVMVAPEKKCLSETLTSLKFAEKVGRTRVGVAKKLR